MIVSMARPPRHDTAGAWHHLMNRGADRQDIVSDDDDRQMFEHHAGELVRRGGICRHEHIPPEALRRLLVQQVTAVVRWRESVLAMREHGVDTLVEVGAGKVLCGLTRRIDRDLSAVPVGAPGEVEALLKAL